MTMALAIAIFHGCKSEKKVTSPDVRSGQATEPGSEFEVEFTPKSTIIPFLYSQWTAQEAELIQVEDRFILGCLKDRPMVLTLFHDPTPDEKTSVKLSQTEKPPISDSGAPVPQEMDVPPLKDTSDWIVLAKIDVPPMPCDQKVLRLNYVFEPEVKVTWEWRDK
jgi:hypothetical protein